MKLPFILFVALFICNVNSVVFYVDPSNGNDNWSGLLAYHSGNDGPFLTLGAARIALAAANKNETSREVKLRGGIYALEATFELQSAHSNVMWSSYNNEEVRIIGGIHVKWTNVVDSGILGRLPVNARENVKQVNLKELGYNYTETFGLPVTGTPGMELFYDDIPMTMARYPNFIPNNSTGSNVLTGNVGNGNSNCFNYTDSRPAAWKTIEDVYLHGYFYWDWSDSVELVTSVDSSNQILCVRKNSGSKEIGTYGVRKGQRYFYFNVLEELDTPGEYYIDRSTGIVYFWPPSSSSSSPLSLLSSFNGDIIVLNGAHNVTFQGIIFEVTQSNAMNLRNVQNVTVNNCIIRNTGRSGIIVAGKGHKITNNIVKYIGQTGLSLSGGDRKALTPANHLVYNNDISYFGRTVFTYKAGVGVSGVGSNISHNHIYNAPHNGIVCGFGNNHVFEYNEVDHVCQDTGDVGAFYIGRDWTSQGMVIKHNYFHDIIGPGLSGASGVYFDDQNSGGLVYGNVFFNVYRSILLGGGRDYTIENNIFIDSIHQNIYIDGRGMDPAFNNTAQLTKQYNDMPTQIPPWSVQYPTLVNLMDDEPYAPKYNYVRRNLKIGKPGLTSITTQARPYMESNVENNNATFSSADLVSYTSRDFTIAATSSVFTNLDFDPIPFRSIGLVQGNPPGLPPTTAPTVAPTVAPTQNPTSPPQEDAGTFVATNAVLALFIAVAMLV